MNNMDHDDNLDLTLIDFLLIIKKRLKFISLGIVLCMGAAALLGFLLPRQWEADAVILPSKSLVQTESGKFEETLLVDPKQIAGQINQGAYDDILAAEFKLTQTSFPKVRAENLKDTNLIKITVRGKDPELNKSVLGKLINLIKTESDVKADIQVRNKDAEIKIKEIEKARLVEEIKILKKKIAVVESRKVDIENELLSTNKRIAGLESEQKTKLREENRSQAESLGMLLYSNEIQQIFRYLDALRELLSMKRIEEESLNLTVRNNEQLGMQREKEIAMLIEKKGFIDHTVVKKTPTSSLGPVFPPRKLFILAGFVLGLLAFVLLAFLFEYWEQNKSGKSPAKR
jgi:uncharacterized protein involved in exopolysaccharide biosynthesis